jgi:hypothetical protein
VVMKEDLNVREEKNRRGYYFDKLGFSLHSDSAREVVFDVFFHIASRAVRFGSFLPYQGLLPYGITSADNRSEVKGRFGIEPYRSVQRAFDDGDTWWDLYQEPPLGFMVVFWTPAENMIQICVTHRPSA